MRAVFDRPETPQSAPTRVAASAKRIVGDLIYSARETATAWAAIGPDTRRGRRFGAFGRGSIICFPPATIMNERYIRIGAGTVIGPDVSLSAGMVPGQRCVTDPVVRIGDRCLIGRGSGIVGHLAIDIGDDVWTGQYVYITDQNHGYDDPRPTDLEAVAAGAAGHDRRRLMAGARDGGAAGRTHRAPRRDRRQQRRDRRHPRLQHRRRRAGESRQESETASDY